ncbi:hypothetical protein HDE_06729 [Halotydeus destructor]|nr:hypothetical protein HDE_06729 [Halotydeus destructor]
MSVTDNVMHMSSAVMEPGWDTLFQFFMNGELLDGFLFSLIRHHTNGTPLVNISAVKNRRAAEPIRFRRWDIFQLKNALFEEHWKTGDVTVVDDTDRKITIKLRSKKNAITIKLENKAKTYRIELPLKYVGSFRSTLHSINLMLGAKRLFEDENELREEVMILLLAELVRKELNQLGLLVRYTGSQPPTMDPNYEQAANIVKTNAGDSGWLFDAIMNGLGVKNAVPMAIEEVDKLLAGPTYQHYLNSETPSELPKLMFPFLVRYILPLRQ